MTDPTARDLIQRLVDEMELWVFDAEVEDIDRAHCLVDEARAYLSKENSQSDAMLTSIRKKTPRYQVSIIISTFDSCIDNRMGIIRLGLNPETEILESVSLPKKLAPLGLATDDIDD